MIAVGFLVISLMPLVNQANIYTERRNLLVGGYFEYLNSTLDQVDLSYESTLRSYGLNMNFGWFLYDDFAIGLKVGYGYSQDKEKVTSSDYDLDIKTDIFKVGLFMRNYIELTGSISFFVESSLVSGFGGTDSHFVSDTLVSYTKSGDRFELEAGIRPGMVIFIRKGLAAEFTVGFLGFSYTRHDTGEDPTDQQASTTQLDFSMDVSLLRIQFGLAVYF